MKVCRTCKRELPLDNFGIKYKHYLQPDCRECKRSTGQEERTVYHRAWVEANRERANQIVYASREKNIHKHRAHAARSRSAKKRATILNDDWLNKQMLSVIYLLSETLSKSTGIPHEVDHIVPLGGKNVCGLHYWGNLQVITKEENRRKSNHHV